MAVASAEAEVQAVHQVMLVAADDAGLRLDQWIRRKFPSATFAVVQKWLRTGQVRIDGRRAKGGVRLEAGQQIRVPPQASAAPSEAKRPAPPELPSKVVRALTDRVLYRDDQVLVIDKPAGLAVQGGSKLHSHLDQMLDALRFGGERPRLVHRLDKDTSGVLLLARTASSAATLAAAFKSKAVHKLYWAAVQGVPQPSTGEIRLPLLKRMTPGGERVVIDPEHGRPAVTRYRIVERAGRQLSWLALEPVTGRTHQLRAHCEAVGLPILGDRKYCGEALPVVDVELGQGLHLHARVVRFPHPVRGTVTVEAPLPPHMRATWRSFGFSEHEPAADEMFED